MLLFGPLMRRLSEAAPNMSAHFVRLDVTVGGRLAAGEADFAVLPAEFEPALPSEALFDDTWVCAAWAGHPSAGDRLTIEEFLMLPHLAFNISDAAHVSVADEYLAERPRAQGRCLDGELHCRAVSALRHSAIDDRAEALGRTYARGR
jgi:DNA-binding transcriptional LysR family regulator